MNVEYGGVACLELVEALKASMRTGFYLADA
jgi:hypothetical protein